ncbi:MAG TPA: hypothetical protein VLG50_04880 [Candidatus Saccharimonadales bacterium]|nr:hypothetical protein [Candidatus Saccharimonadales bacterium]
MNKSLFITLVFTAFVIQASQETNFSTQNSCRNTPAMAPWNEKQTSLRSQSNFLNNSFGSASQAGVSPEPQLTPISATLGRNQSLTLSGSYAQGTETNKISPELVANEAAMSVGLPEAQGSIEESSSSCQVRHDLLRDQIKQSVSSSIAVTSILVQPKATRLVAGTPTLSGSGMSITPMYRK